MKNETNQHTPKPETKVLVEWSDLVRSRPWRVTLCEDGKRMGILCHNSSIKIATQHAREIYGESAIEILNRAAIAKAKGGK